MSDNKNIKPVECALLMENDIETLQFVVRELRDREQACKGRYTKLAGEYNKMKKALRKLDPVVARGFKDSWQL